MKFECKTVEELQQNWRNPYTQWWAAGMPSFDQPSNDPWKQIFIKFKTQEDRKTFSELFDYKLTEKTGVVSYPIKARHKNVENRYVDITNSTEQPRYPIYIISKGRAKYGPHTAKVLHNMGVDFFIAIEPQDYNSYIQSPYIRKEQILVLPFSNHGKGSGPARNWCWEHSEANGHKRHWLMDDNMQDFWRLHKNKRYRAEKGSSIFRATEDFVDRFENVPLLGLQYKFFAVDDCPFPPYILNTRIMSCFLIENNCPVKWRGRYNEDVDLSIRVLKEGLCTMMVYAFLCGKLRTGTVKGGNTEEIYNNYQDDASLKKSKMLVEMHPDCVYLMERYGRIHHYVDLDAIINKHGQPARQNVPILRKDVPIYNKVNNYGMELIREFETETAFIDPSFSENKYPKGRTSIHE